MDCMGLKPKPILTPKCRTETSVDIIGRILEKVGEEFTAKVSKEMIYRKWSLLSGPPVILGGAVVAAVAVGLLIQNVTKGDSKKNVSTNK